MTCNKHPQLGVKWGPLGFLDRFFTFRQPRLPYVPDVNMLLSFPFALVCPTVTEMLVNVLSICSDDELMNDGEEIYDGKISSDIKEITFKPVLPCVNK